ncbi:MAG: hypothetical protein JNL74_07475 [Fibrobacteres bacterium]|nr:hypothetical protein [Fibrobacterota bacterium]
MKAFLYLSLLCAVLYSSEQPTVTVGVLPFTNNSLTNKESLQPLAVGLSDMMATELGKIGSLKIVERAKLNKIVEEMALVQSGILSDDSAIQIGKLSGATMLLLGSFTMGFNGEMRIDIRLVKVETGETVKAEEVTGKPKKLFKMIEKLSFKMAENLKIKLTSEEKEAIEKGLSSNSDFVKIKEMVETVK